MCLCDLGQPLVTVLRSGGRTETPPLHLVRLHGSSRVTVMLPDV